MGNQLTAMAGMRIISVLSEENIRAECEGVSHQPAIELVSLKAVMDSNAGEIIAEQVSHLFLKSAIQRNSLPTNSLNRGRQIMGNWAAQGTDRQIESSYFHHDGKKLYQCHCYDLDMCGVAKNDFQFRYRLAEAANWK
jgi:hypothetical protein